MFFCLDYIQNACSYDAAGGEKQSFFRAIEGLGGVKRECVCVCEREKEREKVGREDR